MNRHNGHCRFPRLGDQSEVMRRERVERDRKRVSREMQESRERCKIEAVEKANKSAEGN